MFVLQDRSPSEPNAGPHWGRFNGRDGARRTPLAQDTLGTGWSVLFFQAQLGILLIKAFSFVQLN